MIQMLKERIYIGTDLLSILFDLIPQSIETIAIITDTTVARHYLPLLLNHFKATPYTVKHYIFRAGERFKNSQTKIRIEEAMCRDGCGRDTLIIALGGGVVGDMAGFIASTYMRGISYIQMPTTLLAMIDSSIGGKTGVNSGYGKNMIGTFWQPIAVIIDLRFLTTLHYTHLRQGMVEGIKMFLIADREQMAMIDEYHEAIRLKSLNESCLLSFIHQAIQIKSAIVSRDPSEKGERAVLNFGHTIGHAIERISNYQLLHGDAVALGLLIEAKISELLGILEPGTYAAIDEVCKKLNIDRLCLKAWDINTLIHYTRWDKKNRGQVVRYVLLQGTGAVYTVFNSVSQMQDFTHPVADDIVRAACEEVIGNAWK